MKRLLTLGFLIAIITAPVAVAGTEGHWLHIRVEEDGSDGERVSINIPLSLVEAILPTIETNDLRGGRIRLDHGNLDDIDLREILEALQDAPDAEFVTVQSRHETVRVAKEAGFLIVRADDDGDRVNVRLPLAIVDAMLSSGDDELDLIAALHALAEYDAGDLVTVESDDSFVRIWIDSSETGD